MIFFLLSLLFLYRHVSETVTLGITVPVTVIRPMAQQSRLAQDSRSCR